MYGALRKRAYTSSQIAGLSVAKSPSCRFYDPVLDAVN